ncbi:hypothetical protein CKO28_13090 [Rhodovibrio sodomensis]|uniref:Serine protease n=1 Tax=Rhodovibrio sodomensis TaxID=1088 RepID=A0ABS1DES6_9PROT|nr:serine protease [Rhodovibrio sodomensis]MBK1668967.1 hypothetical protein [Rhodovibrio sodomensis]
MSCRTTVVCLIGLATFGFFSAGVSAASGGSNLAPCYDPARELVQKVVPANCEGRVVSPTEAEKIRERIKRQRFRQARGSNPGRQPSGSEVVRSGSGVLVTSAGHIVTAAHVVNGCRRIRVHHPSFPTRKATVVARHRNADLALLQTPSKNLTPIAIAFGRTPVSGARMATIGYPNRGRTAIRPIRKAARFGKLRTIGDDGAQGPLRIVFHGDLRPGNSGGALVDQDERLVGVVIAQINTPSIYASTGHVIRNVGFAEPIAALRELLKSSEAQVSAGKPERSRTEAERSVFRVTCHFGGG